MSFQPSHPCIVDISLLMNRYQDAYRQARSLNFIGGVMKAVGVSSGITISVLALVSMLNRSFDYVLIGLMFLVTGAFAFGVPFGLGTMLCASSQLLFAQLDAAVCSSPFLDKPEMAQIMNLAAKSPNQGGDQAGYETNE